MSTRAPLTDFPNNLIDDERLFSQREREIVSALLRHTNDSSSSPETRTAMLQAVERAVGETVAQRAYGLLGSSIVHKLMSEACATGTSSLSALTVPDVRGAGLEEPRVRVSPGTRPPKEPQPPGFEEPEVRVTLAHPHPPGPQPPNFDEPRIKISTIPHPPKQPEPPGFEEPEVRASLAHPNPPGPQPPNFEEPRLSASTMAGPPKSPGQPQPPGFDEPRARVSATARPPKQPEPPNFDDVESRVAMGPRHPPGPQPPGFDEPRARTSTIDPPPRPPEPPNFEDVEVGTERASVAVLDAARAQSRAAQCLVLDEFLMPAEVDALTRYALARENEFKLSEVVAPGQKGEVDFDHRRSRVLVDIGEHQDVIVDRIKCSLARILDKLNLDPFEISRVEAQMTASGDGDFFHQHTDDGEGNVATRELTFVYFFHREPKAFTGGELRIYDSVWKDGYYQAGEKYRSIQPAQNQIVFFPSCLVHEITPIEIPSRAFADSRFTVNGWFRR